VKSSPAKRATATSSSLVFLSRSRRQHRLDAGPATLARIGIVGLDVKGRLNYSRMAVIYFVLSVRTADSAVAAIIFTSFLPLRGTIGSMKVLQALFHALVLGV
jgi:hypothetical protein